MHTTLPTRIALAAVILLTGASSTAFAQAGGAADAAEDVRPPRRAGATYVVVSRGRDVNVRTNANVHSGYPFFTVNEGDLVEFVRENFGWTRVRASTPVFRRASGFIAADDESLVVAADGRTATVSVATTLRAPNRQASERADASWAGLVTLRAGETVELVERIEEPGAAPVWRVRLPARTEAWINSAYLRPATDAEIDRVLAPAVREAAPARTPERTPERAPERTPDRTPDRTPVTPTTTDDSSEASEPAETAGGGETTDDAADDHGERTAGDRTAGERAMADTRAAKLKDLEAAFQRVMQEDIEAAEIELLQLQFIEFAGREDTSDLQRDVATSRAELLAIKVAVQDRLRRLRAMRESTANDIERIDATRVAIDARAPFDAVGRLSASVLFNGEEGLPLLYRLRDVTSGFTVGYVVPSEDFDFAAMTGLVVGVVGRKTFDEQLQLNIIEPRRVDLVTGAGR